MPGNIARTCAVTGARLHLVGPYGFSLDDKHLKRAGLDYWHLLDISYYDSLPDFFEKNPDGAFYYFTTKAHKVYTDIAYPDNSYLFFGREDAGLPEDLLRSDYEHCVRLPMIREARSLNLSNTVAVAVYEVLRQWDFPQLENFGRLPGLTPLKNTRKKARKKKRMEKILLLTDSASDLTPEDEARTGIRVLNLPVSVEGKEYTDRVDLTRMRCTRS